MSQYTECHYAESRYADCLCHYAECRCVESHGAYFQLNVSKFASSTELWLP